MMRFKWYRKRQLPAVMNTFSDLESLDLPDNIVLWFSIFRESLGYSDKFTERFTPQYDRVVDCIKELHNLEVELNNLQAPFGEELPVKDVPIKIKPNILLGDWLVDAECYRYEGLRFEAVVTSALIRIGKEYTQLDYSHKSYFLGKYNSLFLTLRAYVVAISRQ